MTIIPNFNPGSVATAFGTGQQKNANLQSTNIANTVNTDTNNRANARAPLLLQQDKNKLLQQKTAQLIQNMSIAASQHGAEKAALMTKLQLGQSLAPNKQMAYYQSLQPDIHKVFKGAVDPTVNFFNASSPLHQQLTTLYTMLAGPNTGKPISDAQGRQFRINRLTGQYEQVQVNQNQPNQNQTQPVTVPQPTGIKIPAINGSPVPAQTFGSSLSQSSATPAQTSRPAPNNNNNNNNNVIITPKMAANAIKANQNAQKIQIKQDTYKLKKDTYNKKQAQLDAKYKNIYFTNNENNQRTSKLITHLLNNTTGMNNIFGPIKQHEVFITKSSVTAENDYKSIIAKLSLKKLINVKSAGATFGNLTEKELAVVRDAAANLIQSNSPDVIRHNLGIVLYWSKVNAARRDAAYKKRFGKLPSRASRGLPPISKSSSKIPSDWTVIGSSNGRPVYQDKSGQTHIPK